MRTAFITLLLAATAAHGEACKPDSPFDYQWYRARPADKALYTTAWVAPDQTNAICRGAKAAGDAWIFACTSLDYKYFVLPTGAPQWLIDHEEKHRQGCDHP